MADPSKTEPATPKKRREARDRGEVARSPELSSSINLVTGLAILGMAGSTLGAQIGKYASKMFNLISTASGDPGEITAFLLQGGIAVLKLISPVLAGLWLASLLVNYLQVGFELTPNALSPKAGRLNPANGVKRVFSLRGSVELVKASIKILISGVIAWSVLSSRLPDLVQAAHAPLKAGLLLAGSTLSELAWKLALLFLGLGVADFFWQRYEFEKNLRMTKQEVKDEYRQSEGDPVVKSKRRAKHRRLVQTRMAAEVARADVVTTNPTHFAVALKYDGRSMRAPKVVAKGQDYWAKRIIAVARKHRVPVIENKPVARALYKMVDVGREIPPALYRAVAEILAALYKMRARRGV